MDDDLGKRLDSLGHLADSLGIESMALKVAFLGSLEGSQATKKDNVASLEAQASCPSGSSQVRVDPLLDFLEAAADRARFLSESERRSRQAANGIRASGFAFASTLETSTILETLLDYLNWLVAYESASVLFLTEGGSFQVVAAREWRRSEARGPSPEELGLAKAAIERRGPVKSASRNLRCLVLPLLGPMGPVGAVLLIREGQEEFDDDQTRVAEAFAGQAAAAVRNAALYEELRKAQTELVKSYDASIEMLSRALDLRDHETEGHSLRVATLATKLGSTLGIRGEALERLRRGALLHDVGKIGIPDTILLKPGALSDEEMGVMKLHPTYARELLSGISFLASALEVPYCHHERWDGKGYPQGLSGESIPIAARIFSVVDVWDALVHDRPYRKAIDHETARAQLAALSATQLDPSALKAFLAL